VGSYSAPPSTGQAIAHTSATEGLCQLLYPAGLTDGTTGDFVNGNAFIHASVDIRLSAVRTSAMDIGCCGSYVAIGAAGRNARDASTALPPPSSLSPARHPVTASLASLVGAGDRQATALVIRISHDPGPVVRSRRLPPACIVPTPSVSGLYEAGGS